MRLEVEIDKELQEAVRTLVTDYVRRGCNNRAIMNSVESGIYQAVDQLTRCNQTVGSNVLGVSRGTYRAKLKHYGIL